jgi:nicotinamidase
MDADFVPALIVVDTQVDFTTGTLAVPDAPALIAPINAALALPFALKIGTKDFHPPGHISFASTHPGKALFDRITIYPPGEGPEGGRGLEQVLWPDHCVAGTPGADFVPGLDAGALDAVVHKGSHPAVECYSAFRDPWGVAETELERLLAGRDVTDVFVVGLAGDYCVRYTAGDAVRCGFKTWVVQDLVRSVSSERREWDEMKGEGVEVIDSHELKERFRSV